MSNDGQLNVDDLPWANEWCKGREDYKTPFEIVKVQKYDTGLMVTCTEYKGFVYKDSDMYSFLLEALEVFKTTKGNPVKYEQPLYVRMTTRRKVTVCIDDEDGKDAMWTSCTDPTFWKQHIHGQREDEVKKPVQNPLLAGRAVQSTGVENQDAIGIDPVDVARKPPGRGKRTPAVVD